MANVLTQQFDLSYHTSMTYEDTEHMPSTERQFFYSKLVETKKKEEEAMKGGTRL